MKWLLRAVLALLLIAALAAGAAWQWLRSPLALAAPSVELSVEPGTNPAEVARAWVAAGVQADPRALYQWFKWSGRAKEIRAGSYEVHTGITPRELLDKMVRGDQVLEQLRLIEGWNWRQVKAALAVAPSLKPKTATMSDADIMAALGEPGVAPEGRFFPDTYAYSRGVSDLTVLKRAHEAMKKRRQMRRA